MAVAGGGGCRRRWTSDQYAQNPELQIGISVSSSIRYQDDGIGGRWGGVSGCGAGRLQ